jgi:hypothetical protein
MLIIVGAAVVVIVDLIAVRFVHVEPLHEHQQAAADAPN